MKLPTIFVTIVLVSAVAAKKFYVFKTHLNWHLAFRDCEARGLQMATINEWNENHYFRLAMEQSGTLNEWIWISGTDLASVGNFTWMTNGRPLSSIYWLWFPNEPNNYGGNERCINAMLHRTEAKWNDLDCDKKLYYACEDKPSTCDATVST
ncbi:hepatic lectin-like [Atheta coriaria]|uniref:hepatic lectin-like n=1 Tax=Dalotia coriaria TaxID=877792 RepID=UPI0031F3D54B